MAGWAWIHGRNRLSWEERVRLDLWYVDNWTLSLDLSILVKALVLLLRRDGVYGAEANTPDHQEAAGKHLLCFLALKRLSTTQ